MYFSDAGYFLDYCESLAVQQGNDVAARNIASRKQRDHMDKQDLMNGLSLEGLVFDSPITLNNINLVSTRFFNVEFRKDLDLVSCNAKYAVFRGASVLGVASFSGCSFHTTRFDKASMPNAYVTGCNFKNALFYGANLRHARLSSSDFRSANFANATLTGTQFNSSNITGVDFSGAKGMITPLDWMSKYFASDERGWLVYKKIGYTNYNAPEHWDISPGSMLRENVNPSASQACGCGVNFGTLSCIEDLYGSYWVNGIWLCLIPWKHAINITVPILSGAIRHRVNAKARTSSLILLRRLDKNEILDAHRKEQQGEMPVALDYEYQDISLGGETNE